MEEIRLTLTGNKIALLENYKGIIEFTNEQIILQSKSEEVRISGKHMQISYYTKDEMQVQGEIHSIEVKGGRE